MMENLRISSIERNECVTIVVNGREIEAYEGETVLAALQASGFKALNKSKKLGDPRGALCGMGVCYGCLVSINGVQNQRSCMVEVEDKMEIIIDEAKKV
jgi:sarcosine oxidase subunit alpha